MRLMTNGEICRNFRTTIGTDRQKIKRLRELNPDLSNDDIVEILQMGGINVRYRSFFKKPKYNTTAEQMNRLREENETRLRVPVKERESIKEWSMRIGMSYQTLSVILRSTEEDYDEVTRQARYQQQTGGGV